MIEIKCLASGSSGNCYVVNDGSTQIMIEAGISYKQIQRKLNFQTSSIDACLCSHSHGDHSSGIKDVAKAGIDCYLSEVTAQTLGLSGHRIKHIQEKHQFNVKTWTILPFNLEHDVDNLGFLLVSGDNKLIYLTDTAYCRYKFTGLTRIMCECNYSLDILNENIASGEIPAEMKNRLLRTHFSLSNVKAFLKANDLSKVQEIHLIHISDHNGNADRFKSEIQQLTGKPVYIAG